MSAGLSMTAPSILNCAAAITTTMTPKKSVLMGMPQKLPWMMDLRVFDGPGEVAEVQYEGAVDRLPRVRHPAKISRHMAAPVERVIGRPGDRAAGPHEDPHRERGHGEQDDGSGDGLVLTDHVQPVAGR